MIGPTTAFGAPGRPAASRIARQLGFCPVEGTRTSIYGIGRAHDSSIGRATDSHRGSRKAQPCGRHKFKAVAAAAQSRLLQVLAVAVRQGLSDQPTFGIETEDNRRLRVIIVLCPAADAVTR